MIIAALSLSGLALITSILSMWLVVRTRSDRSPREQSVQPSDREVLDATLPADALAGLKEWPEWSVGPIEMKKPRDKDLPTFRITGV